MNGTRLVLFSYGLTAAGTLLGLITGKAGIGRIITFPLTAIPIFLIDVLVLAVVGDLLEPHFRSLPPAAEMTFTIIVCGSFLLFTGWIVGRARGVMTLRQDHKRGTLLEPDRRRLFAAKRRTADRLTLAGQ